MSMKRIGLIGGVSPESTVVYYRLLNAAARRAYGGETSADIIIHSLNYGRMYAYYKASDWPAFKSTVVAAGRGLQAAGADVLAISSNTTNMAADDLAAAVGVPVVFLLETLRDALRAQGVERPLLLGTPVVMEGDFYRPTLRDRFGVETLVPDADDRAVVNRIIFDELVEGVVSDKSRQDYVDVIERNKARGADSVIFGCTEIGMLLEQRHVDLPAFDTTLIHTEALAQFAFIGETA